MLTRLLSLGFLSIFWISTSTYSQCPGSFACEASGVLCGLNQINGFRCNNPVQPNILFPTPWLCFGAGAPHNLNWWAFVGRDDKLFKLTFNLDPSMCETGNGIQAGVFEGNCDGSYVWDCDPDCNTSTFTLAGPTKSCETYYVWVDGCNGDVCSYTISVNDTGRAPTLPPLPALTTSDKVCPCGEFEVCMPDLGGCNPTIEWSRDGDSLGRGDCFRFPVPETAMPGQRIEVCMTATIGNPDDPATICDQDQVCTNFITEPIPQEVGSCIVRCFEDRPLFWQGVPILSSCIVPPCTVRVQGPDGCCIDSIKTCILLPPPSIGQKDTFICDVGVPFRAENGRIYTDEVCGDLVEWQKTVIHPLCPTDIQMCDTSYFLNIGRFKYVKDWEFDCAACSGELTICPNIEYDPDCPNFLGQVKILLNWYDALTGDQLGVTDGLGCIAVTKPGRYCVEIEAQYQGLSCPVSTPECIDIPKEVFDPPINMRGDTQSCYKSISHHEVEPARIYCEYVWRVASGNGEILTPNSLDSNAIRIDWSSATDSFGLVCVSVLTDCSFRDTCVRIRLDSIERFNDRVYLCPADSLVLKVPDEFEEFEWRDGSTDSFLVVKDTGMYCVIGNVAQSDCKQELCFQVDESRVSMTDTLISADSGKGNGSISVTLSTNDSISSMVWSNGDTTLTIDSLESGAYTLRILTENGCEFIFVLNVPMTTLTHLALTTTPLFVAPNPGSELNLLPVDIQSELTSVEIIDMTGKSIRTNPQNITRISSLLNPGHYLIRAVHKDGSEQVLRWVKE